MKELYKGYTITPSYIKSKKIYFVDNAFIFISIEEAKKFCDAFPNKKELYTMANTL